MISHLSSLTSRYINRKSQNKKYLLNDINIAPNPVRLKSWEMQHKYKKIESIENFINYHKKYILMTIISVSFVSFLFILKQI